MPAEIHGMREQIKPRISALRNMAVSRLTNISQPAVQREATMSDICQNRYIPFGIANALQHMTDSFAVFVQTICSKKQRTLIIQ